MAYIDTDLSTAEVHPIDIVESLAETRAWEFDRVGENQIAMAVEGQWRTYALTLAWSAGDETLRLICSFEMDPPAARRTQVLDVINRANDMLWSGSFNLWESQALMVWRYGLLLTGGQMASSSQIARMVLDAVNACERFYPAFQLVAWSDRDPANALQVAIAEAYGRA